MIARLLGLLDEPGAAAVLTAGVEREILWRLLTGPQGAIVRQIGLADSRLAHLARAIIWIRRHFRALTSMTPVQFQKQIRLR